MKGVKSLQRACSKALFSLKRGSPTILSFVAAGGVIGTAILAVKATNEANDILKSDEEEHRKLEIVKSCWKCYIPTVLVGASTIACIFGANVLNKKQQAAMASTYMLLENSYKEYREKTKELLKGSDVEVKKNVVKDKYDESDISVSGELGLYCEYNYGEFFERRQEEVLRAEYQFNLKFMSQGYACLNDFYELLGLDKTEAGEALGWFFGDGYYGCSWIDFTHEFLELEDGMECYIIDTLIPPSLNYRDF